MATQLHVAVLPWSAFGHLIPFFQLSLALAKAGIKVSFISTPRNIQRLPKVSPLLASLVHLVEFPLPTLDNDLHPEGAEATMDVPFEKIDYLKVAYDLLRHPFRRFILEQLPQWPQPPTPSGNKSSERLKLDLSSIQRNPDKNGGLVKRDKIAFFDKECSKVAEHIYLGGDAVARDRDILKKNGITHVLNCVGFFFCAEYFKDDFVCRTLWLQDNPSEDITSILYDVFYYFEDVREQ